MGLDNPRFSLKFSGVFRNRPFLENHRFSEKNAGCFLSKMTGKNGQKLGYKVHTVKCQKRWFFRTPAGALDVVNFGLFFKKNLEKQTIFTPDDFGQNGSNFTRRIFRKITDFLKNVSGFPEIDHFLKNWSFFKNSSFFKKPRVFRKRMDCFSSKMTGKNDQKLNDKVPPMKRRKRWFFRTPAGALDSLTF